MAFLDDNYLLTCPAARDLYSTVKDLPIVDPHNHADVEEIVRNRHWTDIWQVEGATDHYVWELMRRRGVSEDQITGAASNLEKWRALASRFPEFAGNPTYEWIHLDLRRRFGLSDTISKSTADRIWEAAAARLATDDMKPQAVLRDMQVEIMCTTDDPTLDLGLHQRAQSEIADVRILPTWRPDKAMNLRSPKWKPFVERLCGEAGVGASTLSGLEQALAASHHYFGRMGCVASDHGLTTPAAHYVRREVAAHVHARAIGGESIDAEMASDFQAYMLHFFARLNRDAGWVTQLHIGPVRDYRNSLRESLGPDSGGDISTQSLDLVQGLHSLLNEFDGTLKIVLYVVDPTHWPTLATLARAFPNISLGSAWWFNDSPIGMETQLKYLATVDLLANHAGMVTDSRKLLSFGSRTEMFRRVLCQVVGEMIEKGQVPVEPAEWLVRQLSYDRPRELFFG